MFFVVLRPRFLRFLRGARGNYVVVFVLALREHKIGIFCLDAKTGKFGSQRRRSQEEMDSSKAWEIQFAQMDLSKQKASKKSLCKEEVRDFFSCYYTL